MKYLLVLVTTLSCATLGSVPPIKHHAAPLDALGKAKAEIQKLSCSDYNIFAKHLTYYRSWGGYQAVTPAPHDLENQLTPAIKELEQKIQEIVEEVPAFTQISENLPGGSKLTQAGHDFFAKLIEYTQGPCRAQEINFDQLPETRYL